MANYKDIHGTTVRNSAGNLSGAKEGELFFDSTNLDFKYQFPATTTSSWATGGTINTARFQFHGAGAGHGSAVFGGRTPPAVTVRNEHEQYNGSSWTELANLNRE
jgi:hypothetical protein